ncbi:MAG TPA: hypothetical protein VF138_11555 [Caulobacteraceae bacterium]
MTFERLEAGPACRAGCILATGEIEKGSAEAFTQFARANHIRRGARVIFDSPGGVLLEGLRLGRAIRDAGLVTSVGRFEDGEFIAGGQCVSACAYAFLGGVQRRVLGDGRLGVHQFAAAIDSQGLTASDAQTLMGLIAIYLDRMVGKTSVLTLAAATPPADTRWLSAHELRRYALVTD